MRKKMKNIIAAFSAVFVLLLVIIGVNASADASNTTTKIIDFKLKNIGTGYGVNKTTSFLQPENGFTGNSVDSEGNYTIATGDTLSYEVSASTGIVANKRKVEFIFTAPSELKYSYNNWTAEKIANDFCDADNGYDPSEEYQAREASLSNGQLKCTYYVNGRANVQPFGNGKTLNFIVNNTEGKIVESDHIKVEIIEGKAKSGVITPENTSEKIKIVSVPAFDVKITNSGVNPDNIGVKKTKPIDGSAPFVSGINLPKGGKLVVEPYKLVYADYSPNKGYAKITPWSAAVDVSSFPAGTIFKQGGAVVEPVAGKIIIPSTEAAKVEIEVILPYEKEFQEQFKSYGDNVLANENGELEAIGLDKLNEFLDKLLGKGIYEDGKYVGGSNKTLDAKLIVDKDSFKTEQFSNLNGKDLPGANEDRDFSTANVEIDGVKFASVKGQDKFNNNKYNGFIFTRVPDKDLEAEESVSCKDNPGQDKCVPKPPDPKLKAENIFSRPWKEPSTNFEVDRIVYGNDSSDKEVVANSGWPERVVSGNEIKSKAKLTNNTFFNGRGDKNSPLGKKNAVVLLTEFDYSEMEVLGYPKTEDIKFPAEYKKEVCKDDVESCLNNKIIVQVGLDKTYKQNLMEDVSASGWTTLTPEFSVSDWEKLIANHKTKRNSDVNIGSIRVIYLDAVYESEFKYVSDESTISYKGEAIYGEKDYSQQENLAPSSLSANYEFEIPMKIKSDLKNPKEALCEVDGNNDNSSDVKTKFCTRVYSNITVNDTVNNPLSKYPVVKSLIHISTSDPEIAISAKIKGADDSSYGSTTSIKRSYKMGFSVELKPEIKKPMLLDDEFKPEINLSIDACVYDYRKGDVIGEGDFIKENDILQTKVNNELKDSWKITGKKMYRCDQRDKDDSKTIFTLELATKDGYVKVRDGIESKEYSNESYKFSPIYFNATASQLANLQGELPISAEMKIKSYKLKLDNFKEKDNSETEYIDKKDSNVNIVVNLIGDANSKIDAVNEFVERGEPLNYQVKSRSYDPKFSINGDLNSNIVILPAKGHDYTYIDSISKNYLEAGLEQKSQFNGEYILNKVKFDLENTTSGSKLYCTTDSLPKNKLDYNTTEDGKIQIYHNLNWQLMAEVEADSNDASKFTWQFNENNSDDCEDATALKIVQPTTKINEKTDEKEAVRTLALLDIELLPKDNKIADNYLMWISKDQVVLDHQNANSKANDPAPEGQESSSFPWPANIEVVARSLSGHVYWANSKEDNEYKPTSKGWVDQGIELKLYQVDENNKRTSNKPIATTKTDSFGYYFFDRYGLNPYTQEEEKCSSDANKEECIKNIRNAKNDNAEYLKQGQYQVEVNYPEKTKFENIDNVAVESVYRAYSGSEPECNNNTCTIITSTSKDGIPAFGKDVDPDSSITDVDFGFYAFNPKVDIMKTPSLPNCDDKDFCTIDWVIAAKNTGINQLTEVEIVDTMSSEANLESVMYCRINANGQTGAEDECDFNVNPSLPASEINSDSQDKMAQGYKNVTVLALEPTEETNVDNAVQRTYKLDEDKTEFNPGDMIIIEFKTKVDRKKAEGLNVGNIDDYLVIGNQVYINSKETIEANEGKKLTPSFDASTLPKLPLLPNSEKEDFTRIKAGKWLGNENCKAENEWNNQQCDQVYATIPEAGNVGYLEGNVWDTGYEDRNIRGLDDANVRFADAELYIMKADSEAIKYNNKIDDSQLELVDSKMIDVNGYYFFDKINPEEEYVVKISYNVERANGGYYYAFVDPARGKICLDTDLSCALPADYIIDEKEDEEEIEADTRNSADTTGVRVHEASKGAYVPHLKVQPFSVLSNVNAAIFQNKTVIKTTDPYLLEAEDCNTAPKVFLPEIEGIDWDVQHDEKNFKYVIKATAAEGYIIKDRKDTEWTLAYEKEICPIEVEPTLTEVKDCDKLPEVITSEQDGIDWDVKHDEKNSMYIVTAVLKDNYTNHENNKLKWELKYQVNPCPIMPTTGNQSLFYVLMVGLIGAIGLTSKVVLNSRKH